MEQKHILIICGEPSGDLNASRLIHSIRQINPDIKISGVGGELLRREGVSVFYDIKELSVIGLFDVLKKLPRFISLKKLILEKIKREKLDAIILVDFSGFNLRLAKAIDKKIPVIYYISPQVWASRQGRIKTIKKYIDKMLVLFKFEAEFYKRFDMNVDFMGHPLLDIVKPTIEKKEFLKDIGLSLDKTTIALLPGSRKQEIKHILPIMLKASILINKSLTQTQFVIAKLAQVDWDIYNQEIKSINLNLKIVEGKTYDCMDTADFCLVCSGTATVETAIIGKPFIIIYKTGLLNYLLYRPQIKLPLIGIVNIVAGRKIIPEFIQFQATPKNISNEAVRILKDPSRMEEIKSDLSLVKSSLGEKGASSRAAKIIVDFSNK